MNNILHALIQLGFNIDTGSSDNIIAVKDIEDITGIRIVGNGSKIRRDQKPWIYLSYDIIREGKTISGYKFNGYLRPEEKRSRLEEQYANIVKRIKGEERRIQETLIELAHFPTGKPMYDKTDILS